MTFTPEKRSPRWRFVVSNCPSGERFPGDPE